MGTRRLLKRTLGPHFSEGARQLWLEMIRRRWSQARLAAELSEESGKVNRYLYGDRRPGREPSFKFQDRLGIDARLFDQPPAEPFEIPELIDVDGEDDDGHAKTGTDEG